MSKKRHSQVATESRQRMKRGRPISSKDKNPRKQKRNVHRMIKQIRGQGNHPRHRDKAGRL